MKRIVVLIVFCIICSTIIQAQQSNRVNFPEMGLSFDILEGWSGDEQDGFYTMGNHPEIPGLVFIIPHDRKLTVEEMLAEASGGLIFNEGTALTPSGKLERITDRSIGGDFVGKLDYFPAGAHVIGMTNPHGAGITIIAITSKDYYVSHKYKGLALNVMNSVEFSKLVTASSGITANSASQQSSKDGVDIADWKYQLGGTKLTWMESYYSGGDAGGGYNMKEEIHLCTEGYFLFYGQNMVAAGGADVSGYSSSNSKGHGQWNIVSRGSSPILILQYPSGDSKEFVLSWQNGSELFLDDYRYYRTWEGDQAPQCH